MAWVTKDSTETYNQTPEPPREYTKKEKKDHTRFRPAGRRGKEKMKTRRAVIFRNGIKERE